MSLKSYEKISLDEINEAQEKHDQQTSEEQFITALQDASAAAEKATEALNKFGAVLPGHIKNMREAATFKIAFDEAKITEHYCKQLAVKFLKSSEAEVDRLTAKIEKCEHRISVPVYLSFAILYYLIFSAIFIGGIIYANSVLYHLDSMWNLFWICITLVVLCSCLSIYIYQRFKHF